jgi:hypothetical protein
MHGEQSMMGGDSRGQDVSALWAVQALCDGDMGLDFART